MSSTATLFFLLTVTVIFPVFIFFDVSTYFEFLFMSIFLKSILYLFTQKKFKSITNNFLNLAQGILTLLILIMWSYSHNENGILDVSKLMGDSESYYSEALIMSEAKGKSFNELGELSNINYFGFQYLLSKFIYPFNSKYLASLMFVLLIGLLNLLLIFKISILLKFNIKIVTYIGYFYIFFPHILASNTILLKDVVITFSLLLLVFAVISFREKGMSIFLFILYLSVVLVFIVFLRFPFLLLFVIIFYFLFIDKKINYYNVFFFIVFTGLLIFSGFYNQIVEIYEIGNQITEHIAESDVHGSGFADVLVGTYLSDPFYLKVLKLPLVIFVQYVTPVNVLDFSHGIPWSYIDVNLKVLWLVFFGPLFLFSSFQMSYFSGYLKKILIISILGYVFIAYSETGITPRYALPFMCISILPLGFVFHLISEIPELRLKYRKFKFFYGIILSLLFSIYFILKL